MESGYHGAAAPLMPLSGAVAQAQRPLNAPVGLAPDEIQGLLQRIMAAAIGGGGAAGPAASGTSALEAPPDHGHGHPEWRSTARSGGIQGPQSERVPDAGRREGELDRGSAVCAPAVESLDEPAFSTALAAVRTSTELARMLAGLLGFCGTATVVLAVLDRDGALLMAGQADDSPGAGGDWSRVPPHYALPLVRMVSGEQVLWLDGEEDDCVLTWVSDGRPGRRPVDSARARGRSPEPERSLVYMARVAWPSAAAPPAADRERCEQLTARVGWRLRDLALVGLPGDDPRAPWLDAVLDAIPVSAALLLPVRDRDGAVVEFLIDRCNDRATDLRGGAPDQIVGRRLLDVFPGLAPAGVLGAYVAVLETGVPFSRGPFGYEEPYEGVLYPALLSVRAQRVGGGLFVSWQFHDEQARLAARIADAERLMHLAWADWNLVTGEIAWSGGMYAILGMDRDHPPLGLHELSMRVVEEDLPVLARVADAFCERRAAVTFECRLKRHSRPQQVNVTAEPVLNTLGNLVAVRCVVQDVTVRRGIEAALLAARQEVEAQRRVVVEEMQRALLAEYRPRLPGLRVAVGYRSAEDGVQVGGDWFDATALPDGRVLICIGDASGHGLQAAARMAQLRNALIGIAHTGADPARMLDCLNVVACHNQGETAIATAIAAVFDPGRRLLTWARAGHPAPVLVREGRASELHDPGGTALGASDTPGYVRSCAPLRPGDSVILYTDGLLERRADPTSARLDLLFETAARVGGSAPEAQLATLFEVLDTDPEDDRCVIVLRVEDSTDHG